MSRQASGLIKTGIIRERRKNGDIYVYERKTRYDPEKGYSVVLSKTLTGKIPAGQSEIVKTKTRRKFKPSQSETEKSDAPFPGP